MSFQHEYEGITELSCVDWYPHGHPFEVALPLDVVFHLAVFRLRFLFLVDGFVGAAEYLRITGHNWHHHKVWLNRLARGRCC